MSKDNFANMSGAIPKSLSYPPSPVSECIAVRISSHSEGRSGEGSQRQEIPPFTSPSARLEGWVFARGYGLRMT